MRTSPQPVTDEVRGSQPLTQAAVAVAWIIILNKPFYPLYVWWFVGDGVRASLATLLAIPLFLAVPLLARRHSLAARIMLPLAGLVDTLAETKLFGAESGTELFLAPCIMLAALSFRAGEIWWQRGVAAVIFLMFFAAHGRLGAPLFAWTATDMARLMDINIFAVASLMTFIAFRFIGRP